ncbi:hypothetical protein ACH5RR_006623 [Cinchona calisaya]|uniref:Uncharacterized protein n=1 Tax=Cinchona calisaya TaxID=153742 RepID=A0ABD3API7_9GENT
MLFLKVRWCCIPRVRGCPVCRLGMRYAKTSSQQRQEASNRMAQILLDMDPSSFAMAHQFMQGMQQQ